MTYKVIASGSDGNAVLIDDCVLIDCGVNFKALRPYYKELKLVLLTHIHSDHFNKTTIKMLTEERPTLRFGCCKWLVKSLVECGVGLNNIDVFKVNKLYNYAFVSVCAFKLYHDVENCGYRIFKDGKKLFYATDTNHLDGIVAKDYDIYLIEANYEDDEIEERIKYNQEHGNYVHEFREKLTHLSKAQADEFILSNASADCDYCYLHEHKARY